MKKILYILFLIYCLQSGICIIYSQPTQEWAKLYDGPEHLLEFSGGMVVDSIGNVYIVGTTQHNSGENQNFLTLKYAPNGNLLWTAEYNGPGTNSSDIGVAIAIDKAGNIYITGQSEETGIFTDHYATIKYNNNGVQQWVQRYSGSGDVRDEVYGIVVDDSANIYISGSGINSNPANDSATTIKYNTNGAQKWIKRKSGSVESICLDSQGSIYVTGSFTAKYNTNGVLQWVSRLDSLSMSVGGSI